MLRGLDGAPDLDTFNIPFKAKLALLIDRCINALSLANRDIFRYSHLRTSLATGSTNQFTILARGIISVHGFEASSSDPRRLIKTRKGTNLFRLREGNANGGGNGTCSGVFKWTEAGKGIESPRRVESSLD